MHARPRDARRACESAPLARASPAGVSYGRGPCDPRFHCRRACHLHCARAPRQPAPAALRARAARGAADGAAGGLQPSERRLDADGLPRHCPRAPAGGRGQVGRWAPHARCARARLRDAAAQRDVARGECAADHSAARGAGHIATR
eukprot:7190529-Prymnesium_polylepis.1